MKIQPFTNNKGRAIANQFIVFDSEYTAFQSYDSIIVRTRAGSDTRKRQVVLDINKWDYSTTTGKYRNQFLGETKKETQAKINSGEYTLADLN